MRLERNRLLWLCEICGQPIADGDGYVTTCYGEIFAYRSERDAFHERHRNESGWASDSVAELINELPEPPRWRVLHEGCDPDIESADYWISVERIRTLAHLLSWTAHLLGKNWIQLTDWSELLQAVGGLLTPSRERATT